MNPKKLVAASSMLLLLFQTPNIKSQYISAGYLHTSTLQVLGFFTVSTIVGKLLCPDVGETGTLEGRHNPDHDTLDGGTVHYAKWGAALGALSRLLVCPNQFRKTAIPCDCSLTKNIISGLLWTCTGATIAGIAGYLRASALDENHNLECAEDMLKLNLKEQRLVNLAQELSTSKNADEKDTIYKRVATIHANSDYPLVHSHNDYKAIRKRFLRIETYLKRALKNEDADHYEIALIGDLMHKTKRVTHTIEEMLVFISSKKTFTNQLIAQTEMLTIQNNSDD